MEGEEPSIEDIKRCIRKGPIIWTFSRLTAALRLKTKVFSWYWTRVVDYLPCPTEVEPQPIDLMKRVIETGKAHRIE